MHCRVKLKWIMLKKQSVYSKLLPWKIMGLILQSRGGG